MQVPVPPLVVQVAELRVPGPLTMESETTVPSGTGLAPDPEPLSWVTVAVSVWVSPTGSVAVIGLRVISALT